MKKKKLCRSMEWATAHLSHDTMDCIVTQGWGGWAGRAAGATIRPSMLAIQPCDTAIRGPRYSRRARTRAWPLGAGSRYKIVSWLRGGRPLCRDTVQPRAAIRGSAPYDTTHGALRHARQLATRGVHGFGAGCVAIWAVTRPRHGQPCLRHGRPQAAKRPTTRPRHGRPGRSARDLCAQAGLGCASGAPNPILTQCTIFSHYLDHCS